MSGDGSLLEDDKQKGEGNCSILLMDPSEMSTEEKVLSLCTRKEIVPFGDLYSLDMLRESKKVK